MTIPFVIAVPAREENPYDPVSSKAVELTFYNENRQFVGSACISSWDTDIPFFYAFGVEKQFRGQRYGMAIMHYVMENFHPTQLSVEVDNDIAISLYTKFGFKIRRRYDYNNTSLYEMTTDSHRNFDQQHRRHG